MNDYKSVQTYSYIPLLSYISYTIFWTTFWQCFGYVKECKLPNVSEPHLLYCSNAADIYPNGLRKVREFRIK